MTGESLGYRVARQWENSRQQPAGELQIAMLAKLIDDAVEKQIRALIDQVEMNDFRDSHGHDLKLLKAYQDLKTLLTAPPPR